MSQNFFTGFLALGTGSTSFVELTGSGYARQAITFGPIVGATTQSVGGMTFAASVAWPTATQFGLYDASGNLILWWNKRDPIKVATGATFTPSGFFSLTFFDLMSAPPNASLIFAPGAVIGTASDGNPVHIGVSAQIASLQIGAL